MTKVKIFLSKKDFFPLLLPAHKVFFPTQDHPKVSEKIVNVAKNSFLIASKKKKTFDRSFEKSWRGLQDTLDNSLLNDKL